MEKSELQAGAPQKAPREGLSENEAGSPAAPDARITCWVGSRPARLVAQVLLDCVEKARVGRRSLSSEGEENMTNWPQNYERGSGAWTGQRGGGSGQELDNRNPLSPAAPTAMAEIHPFSIFAVGETEATLGSHWLQLKAPMERSRKVTLREGPQGTPRSRVSLGRPAEGRCGDKKTSRVTGTAPAVGAGQWRAFRA